MRVALTWMSALLLCGCLGRGNSDLLQARLREQQQYVAEIEQQNQQAQADLQRARRESEQLRAELERSGKRVVAAEYTESLVRASKLQINSLMSGGLNRDDQSGDDSLVAFIGLVDDDGEVIKLPGVVELTLLDPSLPEPARQVGYWRFSSEECRQKWTRGFTGSGYQFTVKFEEPPQREQLVLHAKLTTADNRVFDANQLIRVTLPAGSQTPQQASIPDDVPAPLDDINDPPPPAAGSSEAPAQSQLQDWELSGESLPAAPAQEFLRDSTNVLKDQYPQRR